VPRGANRGRSRATAGAAPVSAAQPTRSGGDLTVAAYQSLHIVWIAAALYIPEATQAAEISPNFRPQIGHIGR